MQAYAIRYDCLNVFLLAVCSFHVHQSCFLDGYWIHIHFSYYDLPLAVNYTKVEYIARFDQLGRFGDSSVNKDSTALDTLSGEFPSQEEASGPQPLIYTHTH